LKGLEKELGDIKVEPVKKLVERKDFIELSQIKPMKLNKDKLIKSKYLTEFLNYIDETQVTKELCEELDP
jgi:hypothetical protein